MVSIHAASWARGWPRAFAAARGSFLRAAGALVLATVSASAGAQAFTEDFDDITLLAGNGWFLVNNSWPAGTTSWFQDTNIAAGGPFDAYNGAANAYIGANYNSTAGSTGIINDWLLTPNRTLRNGVVLTFYTRKPATPAGVTEYPDRLEVRLSTNGASTNVGTIGANVGDFNILMLSVNPALVAGGYPYAWTQYTVTLSGLPAPTSGRLGFRYFVTSAGPLGTNSDYIGIDNVVYTPYVCPVLTLGPGSLPGGTYQQPYSANLSQVGALGAPNYFVSAGALPPGLTLSFVGAISGTPIAVGTSNFTVTVNDASGCNASRDFSITVDALVPQAPANVTAVAGDAEVTVTWFAGNPGGAPATHHVSCVGGNTVSATGESPVTLGGLVNGTAYTCAVTASNVAGTSAAGISNTVVPMGNQTITFGAQANQTYSPGGSFAIDPPAAATSGLPVTYGTATPDVCAVAGASVAIVAAGTCTITADQEGDVAWNPAPPATQSLAIAQATQTLTFPAQAVTQHWLHVGTTFAISPLATSAEPNAGAPILYSSLAPSICTVKGTKVTMVAAGACVLAADQAGDANYLDATQATTEVLLVAPTEADLWIELDVDESRPAMGATVVYTIHLGNDGEGDVADARLVDAAPDRLDPATVQWQCVSSVGIACPTPASGTGSLDVTIPWLPKNAGLQFTLSGEVIPAADPADDYEEFFNTATIALPTASGLDDPPGNNSSTVGVRVDDTLFADGFESAEP